MDDTAPLIEIDHVSFGYDPGRLILNDISLRFPRGKVTAILGGSGCGKTTLLRLIGGVHAASSGRVVFDGERVDTRDKEMLFRLRRRLGMLFQFGALFTDLTVFENVAFPLREHTELPEDMVRDIVLMKLNAVGLRGAAGLRISEVSGGMARRIALARAIALDPELIMYDEPFAGLDLISMGVAAKLIRTLNDVTGATSLVVSHDVPECMSISDHVVLLANGGRIVAQGTPKELMDSDDPETRQFVRGEPDGPVKFHYPAPELAVDFGLGRAMSSLQRLGVFALDQFRGWGHAALFFLDLLLAVPASLRRFGLVVAQIYAIGNRSLVIILASGLAVGFVLALQMYYALVTYGAAESLGLIVNLALVRELGPVVAGLLFAGRAGTSLTAEIGLMKAGEQIAAMELMAIDPKARVLAPRLIGGLVSMPILAVLFSAIGILGAWVVAVKLIGVDAGNFWSLMQSQVDVWRDVGNGLVKAFVFGLICTVVALYQGFETEATPEGVAYATTRTVVISSLWILGMDFVLTALMFSTP